MTIKEHWTLRIAAGVFLGFFVGNLLFLDYLILSGDKTEGLRVSDLSTQSQNDSEYCDKEGCVSEIYSAIENATQSANNNVSAQETNTVSQTSGNQVKDYYVTFGGGTVTSQSQWVNVPGALAYINPSDYNSINTVTFEASVYIPNGNQTAYVQLYNQTIGHPVWFSEVSLSGGSPQLLISQPITLDPGNNLYQVQMMTQLGFPAVLTQSRVHILTN
jgi:hypothetical protein